MLEATILSSILIVCSLAMAFVPMPTKKITVHTRKNLCRQTTEGSIFWVN